MSANNKLVLYDSWKTK